MHEQTAIIPRRLDRYTLVEHLADGGMASVFLARMQADAHFGKWVAIKVIHDRHVGDPRYESMFLTEARLVAQVDHPNVAQVFDSGIADGTCYLAMEYLSGHTLQRVAQELQRRDKQIPFELAARIIGSAALGLHAAHELRDADDQTLNVVHRDVSPHNLFVLYSGATKVMDFGIAHTLDRDDSEQTAIDELKGKLPYMSPEQLQRFPLDRRSDVFSLGIVLWELTTSTRLFKRRSEGETAIALLSAEIPTPGTFRNDYPARLEQIVMKSLERDLDQRYATASELAHDLEDYLASTGVAAGPPQIADFMRDLFPAGLDECSSSLRRASALVDSFAHADAIADTEKMKASSERPPPTPGRRLGLAALAASVFALLVVGALLLVPGAERDASRTEATEHAPPAAASPERGAVPEVPVAALALEDADGSEDAAGEEPGATSERSVADDEVVAPDDEGSISSRRRARSRSRSSARHESGSPESSAAPAARTAAPEPSSAREVSPAPRDEPQPMTEFE